MSDVGDGQVRSLVRSAYAFHHTKSDRPLPSIFLKELVHCLAGLATSRPPKDNAQRLGRLAVPPHIAELAIGHARKGIEATYDRYSYQAEIGDALARWAHHVDSVIERTAGHDCASARELK